MLYENVVLVDAEALEGDVLSWTSASASASTATCSASVSSRASLSFFAMKKRNREAASGFRLLLLRRRRLQSRLRLLAPVVSAVFGVLFLLFALFSLLVPIPISRNELPFRRNSSVLLFLRIFLDFRFSPFLTPLF